MNPNGNKECFQLQDKNYLDTFFYYYLAQQPPVGQGLLFHEVSRSHTTMHHSR